MEARPQPVGSYGEAVARLEAIKAQESGPAYNPVCRSQALLHGGPTPTVVALLHGITNCPQQWIQFSQLLYDRGHTVVIPRLPQHGLADRQPRHLDRLTAEDFRAWGDSVVDIAVGLGEQVVVMGISAGGVIAAWAAQRRPEVAQAVLVAPSFGAKGLPPLAQRSLMRTLTRLPALHSRPFPNAPPHCYRGHSFRAIGQIMALGWLVLDAARREAPAARRIVSLTNPADDAVDNRLTARLEARWRARGANLTVGRLDAGLRLGHDIIDPRQPYARTSVVYPWLVEQAGL